jgi:hypothetical protein
MGIDSADTNQPSNGEIWMDKSHLLSNNPDRQYYRYTSAPIETAKSLTNNVTDIRRLKGETFFVVFSF